MRRLFPVLLLAFLTFGMPRVAEAQVTVAPFLTSNPQFLDGSGSPLNSGCVFTYAAGTTTPLVTYSDSAGSTPNSNPVLLNSGGFPQAGGIWLTAAAYKFVVKTTGGSNCSTGSTITTTDGITWSTPLSTFNGITSTGNTVIQPATAATGGANQSSPTLCIQGFYFSVTSLTDQWCLSDVVGPGPAPTSTFTVAHSGSGGASTILFPGNVAVGAALGSQSYNGVPNVENYSGSDIGAKVATAFTAAGCASAPCTLKISTPGTYNYSTDINLTSPSFLQCVQGVIINYTGSGNAVKLGADGLVASSPDPYGVTGCTFTGGASMAHGIYINTFVTNPWITNNYFKNFGHATTTDTGYAIYAQAQNWRTKIYFNDFIDTDGVARNKVRVRGKSVAAVSDNGNSQLFFVGNLMTAPSNTGGSAAAGIGVWFTGTGSVITDNKIEGYAPNIRVAPASQGAMIGHNYFEEINNTCNIEFGDLSTGDSPSNFVLNLIVRDSPSANMHNTDSFATTANFICPTAGNTLTGLQNARIRDNNLSGVSSTIPMVGLNNVASQTNNESSGNTGQTLEHATGASIAAWRSFINGQYANGVDDSANGNYLDLKEGATANNSKGIAARGFNNTLQGLCDWDLNGVFRCLAGTGLNNVIRGDTSGNVTLSKAGQITTTAGFALSGNKVFVTADFTTANNTSLQNITGLTWTFPATAANWSFHCSLLYSQATAAVADQFGIQAATNNPTNIAASALAYSSASVSTLGTVPTLATTTATPLVTFTPSATATVFTATLEGTLELAASANTVNIMVQTSAGADAVTVKRGSYCQLF